MPPKSRVGVANTEGGGIETPSTAELGGVWGGMSLSQPTRGAWGVSCVSLRGFGRIPCLEHILAYFEGQRTPPFCTYMPMLVR